MPVPEASMDENGLFLPPEYDVGFPWESLQVEPIAIPGRV